MSTRANGVAGNVVVITGASSGIGEATARMLARHGARLVVEARWIERLAALVAPNCSAALRAAGGTAKYQAVDVTQREEVEALVNLARSTYGPVRSTETSDNGVSNSLRLRRGAAFATSAETGASWPTALTKPKAEPC